MGRTVYRVVVDGSSGHLGTTTAPFRAVQYGIDGIQGTSDDDGSSWWTPLDRVVYVLALDEDKVKLLQQQMREAIETDKRRQELAGLKTGVIS